MVPEVFFFEFYVHLQWATSAESSDTVNSGLGAWVSVCPPPCIISKDAKLPLCKMPQ